MRPATVAKWLQENANAPPPPATPAGLPDDSASTVYPESSVSNPNASRYTGTRHRGLAVSRVPQQYLERRPSTPQGHRREYHASPAAIPPRPQHQRYQSLSTDSRHSPLQHQPYTYTYAPAQSSPFYLAPGAVRSTGHVGYSRGTGHRTHQTPQYQLVPHPPVRRAETVPPRDARGYAQYSRYASTPAIAIQARSAPKKAPLLRRLFGGIEWGHTAPKPSSSKPPRHSSRSSSKSKSKSLDYESSYRPPSRQRRNSEGVVYVRY